MDSGSSIDNNEDVKGPINAKKYFSHKRRVDCYATLKLYRAQYSQVERRQEHQRSFHMGANSRKRSVQLLERQPRKTSSTQTDDGESTHLKNENYNNNYLHAILAWAKKLYIYLESSGIL